MQSRKNIKSVAALSVCQPVSHTAEVTVARDDDVQKSQGDGLVQSFSMIVITSRHSHYGK